MLVEATLDVRGLLGLESVRLPEGVLELLEQGGLLGFQEPSGSLAVIGVEVDGVLGGEPLLARRAPCR